MKQLTVLLLLFVSISALTQSKETISVNFQNEKFEKVIGNLESQTSYSFYYKNEWVDSLNITLKLDNVTLEEVLNGIIGGTKLTFITLNNQVYFVNDLKIIDSPQILNAILPSKSDESLEKGLIFKKEYITGSSLESKTFEIGSRNEFKPGRNSTVAGYIKDVQNGNPVEGVFIFTADMAKATTSDASGFYSINLNNGKNHLQFQLLGMKSTSRKLVVFSDGRLDVQMEEDVISLQEVTISSDRDANVLQTRMGITRIDATATKNVPVVLGEKDIMKIATTISGVQTMGEGAAGYNVRGGKADQNLILIDGAPVYNANHFFGFFSVFNSDAIDNLELHKSSIPAKYGGRLSSVFDLSTKKASKEKFIGNGGVSPVSSKFTAEIPVIKEKAGLLLSARSTYSNWVLKKIDNPSFSENRVNFNDFLFRYDHDLTEKDQITLTGYYSTDRFRLASDTLFSFSKFAYNNNNASLNWRHIFNEKWIANNSIRFSNYGYSLDYNESPRNAFTQDFQLNEKSAKSELNFYPNDSHEVMMGANVSNYLVNPGRKRPQGDESLISPKVLNPEEGWEAALFVSDQMELTPEFSLYVGLRYSAFGMVGPGKVNQYLPGEPINDNTLSKTINYNDGEIIKLYHGLEPRITTRYALNEESSIKAGYNRNRQYLHTLSNSASLSPTDVWRLSGYYLKPQIADQFSIGYYRNVTQKLIETSVELYYKNIQNLVDFKTGEEFLLNESVETSLLQGPGKSYGIELSLHKSGKLNGWINYTYARTFIKLDGEHLEEKINGGEFFPTNYDKPHTLNVVANYKFTRRISLSFNMNYSSGRPVTYPVSTYYYKGSQFVNYSNRNAYRIPDYFRIDAGFNLEAGHKIKKLAHNYWSFSIYNIM
ncbi:MAG: TonB-dependent receptor, partial [Cyclobacteriaceae bacterium]|nr:TonB-dependent receptor [Cyclobacteriaceae bacterium]